jgi:hypothetical protein
VCGVRRGGRSGPHTSHVSLALSPLSDRTLPLSVQSVGGWVLLDKFVRLHFISTSAVVHRRESRTYFAQRMFRILSLLAAAPAVYALYSVHYIAGNDQPQLVGKQKYLTRSPEPVQVADIYSRMSGMSPLLHEGFVCVLLSIILP